MGPDGANTACKQHIPIAGIITALEVLPTAFLSLPQHQVSLFSFSLAAASALKNSFLVPMVTHQALGPELCVILTDAGQLMFFGFDHLQSLVCVRLLDFWAVLKVVNVISPSSSFSLSPKTSGCLALWNVSLS